MATRLPPELAGELYCRANIEPMIYNVMNPQIATDLLDKAWGMLTQGRISFSFNYIDKPKEGSGFFLKVQPEEIMMPHDGYQYMDDEVTYNYPPDNRLSITERSQGFAHGDQYTHIVRRKYTLVQPGREPLAFLHYSKADVSRTVVVDGRRAKTPARQYPLKPIPGAGMPQPQPPPPQQQQQQQVYQQGYRPQQPPKMAGPYGGSPIAGPPASPQQGNYGRFGAVPAPIAAPPGQQQPQRMQPVNPGSYGNQRHEKKSSHKKHQQQKQQLTPQQQAQVLAQQQAQAQEDAEEPSGDELDFLTARDVAIARYKRNHDYIAEVFSPYPTSRIIPTRPEYQKSIGFLKSLSEKHGDDLDVLKNEHDEKIKKFKAEAAVFYKGLEELKQATTNQEVIAANERVEVYKGMTVQSYTALRQIDLPKDEATRTPELKPSRTPKLTDVPDAVMVAPMAPVANIAIPGMIGAVVTNGIVAGGAQGEMAGAIAAAGAMDVDTAMINPVQQSIAPVVSHDIEMTSTADISNIASAPEFQAAIPTAAVVTADESSVPAIEQPVAIASDIVMDEQQPIAQVQTIQEATPVTEPTPVSITPIEMSIETPTAITASETFTPVQPPAITEDPTTTPAIPVTIAAEQPVIAETIVQQSSTNSAGNDNHVMTTTSSSFTASLTDASGTTVTDMTKTADTTVSYSDGRQEQFPQQVVHEHHVEHTQEQAPVLVTQVENTPQEALSTVTVTDISPNATESEPSTATLAPTDIVADGEMLAQPVAQPAAQPVTQPVAQPIDPISGFIAPAAEALTSESTTQLGESSALEGAPQEQQQQNQPQYQPQYQQQQQYHPGSFGH